jgi:hypothetical protein
LVTDVSPVSGQRSTGSLDAFLRWVLDISPVARLIYGVYHVFMLLETISRL